MKKKRTVWFGVPVIIVRGVVLSSVLFAVVFVGGWELLMYAIESKWVPIEMFTDRPWMMWMLVLSPFAAVLGSWALASRLVEPMARFQKLKGRMCFVCGYEIGEGFEECSECGAPWSFDDLNRAYRWMAEGKK